MSPDQVAQSLEVIGAQYGRIQVASAPRVLAEAIAQVRATYEAYARKLKRRQAASWGFVIARESPLEFVRTTLRGLQMSADLACRLEWTDPGMLPVRQEILVRLWAYDEEVIYREGLDDIEILGSLEGTPTRRVMLRYHFDLANAGQEGPKYHLQAGGNPLPTEGCWLHEGVSVPRVAHPPLDLVLACEMIATNLYPQDADRIHAEPTVVGVIRASQLENLREYFHRCLATVDAGERLLDALWNVA
jgi:hypothetical protein